MSNAADVAIDLNFSDNEKAVHFMNTHGLKLGQKFRIIDEEGVYALTLLCRGIHLEKNGHYHDIYFNNLVNGKYQVEAIETPP